MAISQERFEEIVLAVAASRFQQVRVTDFTIWVTVKSRRRHRTYEVYAVYDPEADHWTGYDPYHGLTLSSFTHHVHQAFRNAGIN
jgi:hypothetical protein